MNVEIITLLLVLALSITGGILIAKVNKSKRQRKLLTERLDLAFSEKSEQSQSVTVRKEKESEDSSDFFNSNWIKKHIKSFSDVAGIENGYEKFLRISIVLFFLPLILAVAFEVHLIYGLVAGILLVLAPYIGLLVKVKRIQQKFITQLPEAIDLMVSVLKTGHSIPRAIQTVSEEVPSPLGSEFKEVHQRLNLGQPLSQALTLSVSKFDSYELDLIRRAVSIQSEVGGSLAELLDKTNSTLKQRLKLARQVKVLTSQSKLTAIIVGLLPIILGLALNFLNPGYLDPLFNKEIGQLLLMFAVGLEIVGIFVMRKLSYIKV